MVSTQESIKVGTNIGRIDLLINVGAEEGFICEHKVFSELSDNQIEKYIENAGQLGNRTYHSVLVTLTKLGIDMGVDDKVVYNITSNGQVNIANDNAVINATNNNYSIDLEKIEQVIKTLREEGVKSNLSKEDKETLSNSLEIINDEIKVEKPRKAYLSMALTGLKAIKGTAEFGASVTALYQFIQPFIM